MKNRKVISFIITLSLVFSSFSVSFATESATSSDSVTFTDVTDHWGAAAISKWAGYGIINGFEGKFRPDDSITRGEMAVILDNMMDYQEVATNTFADLQAGQFYTEAVLKANAAGILKGDGVTVRPNDKITKEEAAIMMSRSFGVAEASSTKAFLDASAVSDWAKSAVFGMEVKGYVSGFGGYFNPKANITRAEAVTMINNIVKAYYATAGTYTESVDGTAVIKVSNVILKGVTISENLIIAEGVAQGDATLDSVTVKGETVIRGGGENSVHIVGNSNITKVTIEKVGDKLRVVIDDGITISNVEVASGEEIIISGSVGTVEVNAPNATIYADAAEITNATIAGNNSTIVVGAQSVVGTVSVASTAENTKIQTETGAKITSITAAADVSVTGTGSVTKVVLKEGADGSSITTPNTATTVPTGVTGVTGGGGTAIPAGSTGTNGSTGTTATVTKTTSSSSGGNSGGSSTIAVTSVTVTGTAVTITTDNGTLQMSAIIAPTNATNQNVTWSVTNGTGYATISSNGLLTAVSSGAVTVSAVSVSNGTVSGTLGITLSNQVNDAITTAAVTRTSPAVGEAGSNASVSASANYEHTSTVWSGSSGAGATYVVGDTPAAIITLAAKTGYTFTGLLATNITVTGGTVTYGGGQGVVSGGAFVVFTVTYPQLTSSISSAIATCTAPAIGEAGANATVAGGASYTHTSTVWTGKAGGTFVAGETPAAIITLSGNSGYGFTGLQASNITVAGGTVSYAAGQGVTAGGVSVVFTATYSQLIGTITSAAVTITAPALGATPPNAAAVEAATSNANFTVTGLTWNGDLTSLGKFKADQAYSASIILTSKNYNKFQSAAFMPTVAGSSSVDTTTTVGTAVGNTVSFTVIYTTTGALTISSITVTTQPTNLSYMESATLALNGMVITETNNDGSTAAALFTSGTNANYSASPANGSTLTTAYNGTPVAITHISTGKTCTTAALAVASTVSAINSADVSITHGSIVFEYTFTGTNGAITYAEGKAGPYYLDDVASTVTLKNSTSSTAAISLSALGISDSGTVSYAAITNIQSVFSGLNFIPTQVAISLRGATSINGGANQWSYNINVDLDPMEIDLLVPDPIGAVTVSVTPPAIGVVLVNATVAPGSFCTPSSTIWTGKADATYAAGETPAAIISLAADPDYTFTGITAGSITVSGGSVTFESGQGVTAGGMAVTFTVTYTQLIGTITTAGAVCASPMIGYATPPSQEATVDAGANYIYVSTTWSGYSEPLWASGDTPSAIIVLSAKTGYTFTGLAAGSITVSGGSVTYESGQGVTAGGMSVVFTVTYPQLLAASTPTSITLAAGSTNGALNITDVVIPAAWATDSTGSVDWASGTNDKIKFTVTDDTGTSLITINSSAYTSGNDYTITTAGILTIVVTTTEAGKATCERTFMVAVTQAALATTPGSFTLASGTSNPATIGAIISTIPASGGTNSEGSVTDWITGTNDRIKFTVADAGGTSTITINGDDYTSGADYIITTIGALTFVVTTTESNKVTCIRTFTVSVTAAPYATTPGSIELAAGGTSSAAIGTNITTIPEAGGTNTEGVITGWIADVTDTVKFNVTASGGGEVSTITINGGAYVSGNDYTIAGVGTLTIVVTSTESGKTTAIRTFTVNVTL